MKSETFTGTSVPELLAEARANMGADAVILSVRRLAGRRRHFELLAANPPTVPEETPSRRPPRRVETEPLPSRVVLEELPTVIPLVLALVGPTGAGKTTTIAKLANHTEIFGHRAVGLISLDTYRVGAVEQIQVYADLSRLPLEIVYDGGQVRRALRRLDHCDVILVDTPGRGPLRRQDSKVIRSLLAMIHPMEVHLTLPGGLNETHARRLVGDYRGFGVTHLLPTKLDEYPEEETLFTLAEEFFLPVRWVTNGQRVPKNVQFEEFWPHRRGEGPADILKSVAVTA
jgi:flagellar biosynthesis protein FlhF